MERPDAHMEAVVSAIIEARELGRLADTLRLSGQREPADYFSMLVDEIDHGLMTMEPVDPALLRPTYSFERPVEWFSDSQSR